MSYPKAWSYIAQNRLPISKQRVKLLPSTPVTANPGDTVAFQLPSNTMVDLKSLSINGYLTTATTAGFAVVPFAEAIIEALGIEINGQVISANHAFYNQIFKLSADLMLGDRISLRKILQLQQDPATIAAPTVNQGAVPFAITNFLGFLGTSSCSVIDTSAIGNVRILMRLASPAILAQSSACTGPSYSLVTGTSGGALNATVDVVDVLDSGTYGQLLQRRLSESPLQINWTDYVAIQGGLSSATQATRFSVATQSLDAIHATFLPSDYNVQTGGTVDAYAGSSHYFSRGTNANGGTPSLLTLTNSFFTFNAQNYPAFGPALPEEAFLQSMLAWSETQTTLGVCHPKLTTLANWVGSLFFHSLRFNVLPSLGETPLLSGINTTGNTVLSSWTTNGSGTNVLPLIFLEHTRTMSISAGRQISIIA